MQNTKVRGMLSCARFHWRRILAFLIPVLLSPLIIIYDSKEARCAYVILLMTTYWMFELIHLSVTSLLPIFLFPMLGVLSTTQSSLPYMQDLIVMYLCGMMMATAVENCNLHTRIALKILLKTGMQTKWLLFGFMMTTLFLSMWLSNMATTLMVLPVIDAVTQEVHQKFEKDAAESGCENAISEVPSDQKSESQQTQDSAKTICQKESSDLKGNLDKGMLLGVAYSANIGGIGSVTGTAPNLVMLGLVQDMYPNATSLTFATWLLYNVPPMILCVLGAWIYLYIFFIPKRFKVTSKDDTSLQLIIEKKYDELGKMSFHEKAVMTLFACMVVLWFFRDPHFIPGWISFLPGGKMIRDATPAVGIIVLLFLIPAQPSRFKESPGLLDWTTAQKKVPWGVLLLMGGSFSMAEASKISGLSLMVGEFLTNLKGMNTTLLVILLSTFTAAVTELVSNTATASVLLPVTGYLAEALEIHPFKLMLPVTICCSFAFMFPVASPPNAMVYDHSNMKTLDMVKAGLPMNLLCVSIEVVMIHSLGLVIFDLGHFPDWAHRNFNISATN